MSELRKKYSGSIYSDFEKRFLGPWQGIRQLVLAPFVKILLRLGVTADMLSFTSAGLGVGFFLLVNVNFVLAFWLLIGSIILDGLDGVGARLMGKLTTRGAFTDMFCDQVVVVFSVAGLVWYGLVNPVLAILFVYVYTALVTFLVIHKLLQVSSFGLVRPSRMLLYAFIALYFFLKVNWLNYLLAFYMLTLLLVVVSFWKLRKSM